MLKIEPTQRFSSRVQNYARFRPSYPREVLHVLEEECGLAPDTVVADVASGTGLFTRLLLEHGNPVFGVEPNSDMRRAGEECLAEFRNFVSVDGTAEHTTLPDHSVDLVTCAQAAHWFDRDQAILEFQRILKTGGYLVLLWNDRRIEGSALGRDYERMVIEYGTDYAEVQRRDQASGDFFGPLPRGKRVLANHQDLDFDSLQGRLLSSSYVPHSGESGHQPMLAELRRIFDLHQRSGRVRMEYDTKIFFGKLSSRSQEI
jgi:SAM-dependent methyltransferase